MEYKLSFRKIILLLAILASVSSAESQPETEIDHASYRLPKGIEPISYNLSLQTRLGASDFAYQGNVNVTLRVLNRTNTIVVNSVDLVIAQEKSLLYRVGEPANRILIGDQRYNAEKQFFIVDLLENLEPAEYVLVLHFDGEVRDDVFGFYRSSYDVDGEKKWMGVTQFSPTHARRAFPCMDEPHLKAVFRLSIGHSSNQRATSNTVIERRTKDSNNENSLTTFSPTPRMSTYLVGWAVHDFVSEAANSSANFKIWTRKSMSHRGTTSLNRGRSIYQALQNWLSVKNPIPKMDQFAVADFYFNAMENWGMITYRESVVLSENGVTPTKTIINGLTTMAHEYAHTWFGNLVTPEFWNVAWLKEGFASYFQHFGVSLVEPGWRMMEKFVVETLQPTLLSDSVDHNRTMNGLNVGSPGSIMSAMDFVSYKKGASVIRMLSHVIGDSAFQAGLQNYLRNMSYRAAAPSDLYVHLQTASDSSGQLRSDILIKDVAASWTNQPGYPVLNVSRNYDSRSLVVSQERFYQNGDRFAQNDDSGWWIPLNFATMSTIADFSRTTARNWLRPRDKSLTIDPFRPEDWVVFNVQQVGFYRVNYDETNWRMLIDYLRSKDFSNVPGVNRAALLDDAFNLARAGYIDYSIPFNLSSYLLQETEYVPWVAATSNFKFLNDMLHSVPSVHRAFQEKIGRLLEPIYKQLSFTERPHEDLTTKLHRGLILSAACSVNNAHCLRTSKTLFGSWISTADKTILQDVKSFVYCEGIRSGNENDWYEIWDRFLRTDLHTEQELMLQALGCTRNARLINRYLNSSISGEHGIRKQYRIAVINAALNGDPANVGHTLEFVRRNWKRIIDSRGYDFASKVVTEIGNKITTEEHAEKLRSFVDEKMDELGSTLAAAKQAIISSTGNVEWVKKYSSNIANCLT